MRRSVGIFLVALLTACGPQQSGGPAPDGGLPSAIQKNGDSTVKGLKFELSEGKLDKPVLTSGSGATTVAGTALEQLRIDTMLDALGPEPTAQTESFALRKGSLPPPRTGQTVKTSFPPAPVKNAPPIVEKKDFEVVRYQPDGAVPIAPKFTVTFSQPMISLSSHDDAVKTIPVELDPLPPGKWRWVGTRTLVFEPDGERFPMATRYTATVNAGTKSALGDVLPEDVIWTFETPPVQVEVWAPGNYDPIARRQVYAVQANQKIDADALSKHIEIKARGKSWAFEQVGKEALENDPLAKWFVPQLKDDRWVAIRPLEPLPFEASVDVTLLSGAPSAEGPLPTTYPQSMGFSVHGPLDVVGSRCGWDQCRPWDGLEIEVSNPLDPETFDPEMVVIDPEIPHAQISAYGRFIQVYGQTRGRTTYTVKLDPALVDVFGETMGEEDTMSFEVGDPYPQLSGPGWDTTVLDPNGESVYTVSSIGYDELQIRMLRVQPDDFPKYTAFRDEYMYGGLGHVLKPAPGEEVRTWKVKVADQGSGEQVETRIDISEALAKDGLGHVLLIVEPTDPPLDQYYRPAVVAWVQKTNMALTAYTDPTGTLAWVTHIKDGKPIEGAKVTAIEPEMKSATTDASGMVRFDNTRKEHRALLVTLGNDTAMLPWRNAYATHEEGSPIGWYVLDDRQMYKPNESVRVKGWLRQWNSDQTVLSRLNAKGAKITWKASDAYGNEFAKGTAALGGLDGFDLTFDIPDNVNLGYAHLSLELEELKGRSNRVYGHSFQIQEFRRPEFEVSATSSEGPHIVGGAADVTVNAKYYTGGALPAAPVDWSVYASPGYFSPPNQSDYAFGHQMSWWWDPALNSGSEWKNLQGETDGSGRHKLHVDLLDMNPPRTMSLTGTASVTDVNRQMWSATETLVIHPADEYVGIKSDKVFVEADEPARFDFIVADLDGKLVTDRTIEVDVTFLEWKNVDGWWQQVPDEDGEIQRCTETSASDAVSCEFSFTNGGLYRVRARIADASGRLNESQVSLWVAGGDRPADRTLTQEEVILIPDKESYDPGETAQIMVQAPFGPGEGMLTVRRANLVSQRRFALDGSSATLEVPIVDSHMAGIQVRVDVLGSAARTDDEGKKLPDLPRRPAFATGVVSLAVSAESRRLTVEPTPANGVVAPGARTSVGVLVKDASGAAVKDAEVLLVVVDESVLALSNYQVADPISVFYGFTWPQVYESFLHSRMVIENSAFVTDNVETTTANTAMPVAQAMSRSEGDFGGGGLGTSGGGRASGADLMDAERTLAPAPVVTAELAADSKAVAGKKSKSGNARNGQQGLVTALRSNFDALAVFEASAVTDAQGRVTVPIDMPDNLTKYRVIAVAAADQNQFGTGESSIQARMPLMVRPSPPRFLNMGDTFELPIVVENPTDQALEVDVAVRAANLTLEYQGRRIEVPARNRVEVRFPASTVIPGEAAIQVMIATSDDTQSDASEVRVPVWTPATTEAFAVYGEIDKGAIAQPVAMPSDVATEFGGLEITTSSTALSALTDAVLYLVQYKFECSEQMSSRLLAIASLRDVLAAFEAEGLPSPEEISAAAERDIQYLSARQNYDGGFPWWRWGQESSPYLSVHVMHAFVRAKEKGYDVPAHVVQNGTYYLTNIESYIPYHYGIQTKYAIMSYALYVRFLMGEDVTEEAKAIVANPGLDALSLETTGWLLSVMAGKKSADSELAEIRKLLNNRVSEEAGTAHFAFNYSDGNHVLLHSDRRTDAVILDGLMRDNPKNDLIPKIVRGLLGHRVRGRWLNTQENAFVLVGLYEYFDRFEKESPNFVARIWLGDDYAGDYEYKGRSTDQHQVDIPMSWLAAGGAKDLVVQRDGKKGRLYYRLGMKYAPKSLVLEPSDHGFSVDRVYESVDDDGDVWRDDQGQWHVKAGARVRVRLSMFTSDRRYHVALVDQMPAGLEAMNPALAVTGNIPVDPNAAPDDMWWWWYTWYEHQNMRDERVEAFSRLVWEGVWDYSYVARATTPGTFIVPPAKAEEMYQPETFGRSGSNVLIVE